MKINSSNILIPHVEIKSSGTQSQDGTTPTTLVAITADLGDALIGLGTVVKEIVTKTDFDGVVERIVFIDVLLEVLKYRERFVITWVRSMVEGIPRAGSLHTLTISMSQAQFPLIQTNSGFLDVGARKNAR
ncbi:unnamed protein product [Sphagnum balticum]